ncbi:MAG TPA: hypothetical protein VMB25_11195 [Bryobacteraceae bacterium]|nr:hypothetical protein [Bryobacteraceae bacterium]
MQRVFPRIILVVLLAAGAIWLCAERLEDTFYVPLDDPAIQYAGPTGDPVARLEQRLEAGQAHLDFSPDRGGYLASVLQQLNVPIDSQVLVFSKTSTQVAHIAPRTPRAIYFNADVAVGYVQNGDVLEFSSLDPKQGVILYSLDIEKTAKPEFARRDDCLKCHQGAPTLGVPGLLVSSVHPLSDQLRDVHGAAFVTDDRTDFKDRWGGWYVTGTTGAQFHLGNNIALADPLDPGYASHNGTQNLTSLDKFFDTSRYLAPTSDIVALMTLEHQTRMVNLFTRIGWDTRIALRQGKGKLDDTARQRLDPEIEDLVTYMLFTDEAPIQEPITGVSTFTKTFPLRGPRDSRGRSLRDFDLQTRLFRYPLSYMIYSAAFDALPDPARSRVYQRLYDVLTGKDQSAPFAHLSPTDRANVLAILRQTKTGLPKYWLEPK